MSLPHELTEVQTNYDGSVFVVYLDNGTPCSESVPFVELPTWSENKSKKTHNIEVVGVFTSGEHINGLLSKLHSGEYIYVLRT